MTHRIAWGLAVGTAVAFLGWIAAAVRQDRLRAGLLGRGRHPLVVGFAAGVALSLPTALLLQRLPYGASLPGAGAFLAVAAAGFAVSERGYVPSVIATGIPIALLRFASRGCGDTTSGAAATCIPTPLGVAALQAVAGALAVSAVGYLVGRGAAALQRRVSAGAPGA